MSRINVRSLYGLMCLLLAMHWLVSGVLMGDYRAAIDACVVTASTIGVVHSWLIED